PVGVAFRANAEPGRLPGDLDYARLPDDSVGAAEAGFEAGDQEAAYVVLVFDVHETLVLQRDAEDLLLLTAVDLRDDPGGGRLVVVQSEHIQPVRAPIEQVRALTLQSDQLADRALVQHSLRLLERFEESALVVEGELDVVLLASPVHPL